MYIYDALYGKIDFPQIVWKCMMSPEVQRLREVRLCNINSLCITGSANTNRFEHSVGTAFLAMYNMQTNENKYSYQKRDVENFVLAALLHDISNGPFGHSYEYLKEKQGFVPEKGLKNTFSPLTQYGQGATGYSSPYEKIFFGKPRALTEILSETQKTVISDIIAGDHYLSKLLVNTIDLDNIDNVFRMAYHMGIPFPIEAPLELAKSMYIKDGCVLFDASAKSYLEIWYETRKKMYKFLLLNPQEFAGKYMLTEALDITFESMLQNDTPWDIKWYFTDYELLENLDKQKELWLARHDILKKNIGQNIYDNFKRLDSETQIVELKKLIESIDLTTPIKEKGKKGNSNRIILSNTFKYEFLENTASLLIRDRNMVFEIRNDNLYKKILVKYNPSQIISRLVSGDLYDCLMIIKSSDIDKYNKFLNYQSRLEIENELESFVRTDKVFQSLNIGIHPILDCNKTERKLEITLDGNPDPIQIGNSSRDLLLGIFLKNEPYGLKHSKIPLKNHREKLIEYVLDFFSSFLDGEIKTVELYDEVNKYGCKRY